MNKISTFKRLLFVGGLALSLVSSDLYAQHSVVLQQWQLATDNSDDPEVRAASIVATTPVLHKLYLANGTTDANTPPYSSERGMAFGATENGDGTWSSAAGGPGGSLNRTFYVQFTVAASTATRVDSIQLTSSFNGTSANTRMAVVYSKSGFLSDSMNVTGGKGPAGVLADGANGGFTTPIVFSSGQVPPVNTYRLALNGAEGVTLAADESLTIRVYYSCSSSLSGKYAMMKNVIVKGESLVVAGMKKLTADEAGVIFTPNPVVDNLAITHPVSKEGRIQLYTFEGKNVATFTTQPSTSETTVNLVSLPPGAYLVVYSDDKIRVSSKIIKL